MSLLPNKLTFGETSLAIIDRHGEPWLAARELARALGYADERGVLRIYSRNQEEFTDEMTCVVNLTPQVDDQRRDVRVFSARGCYAIGFFAKTDRAKAFRRWVLDVLETHVRGNGAACRLMPLLALTRKRWGHVFTPKGFNSVSLNAALVLSYLLEECDDNRWHSLSYREMGEAIGISHTSVYKVLVRLEEWDLVGRRPGSTGRPSQVRVYSRKIRQQLKQGSLGSDDRLPWLH
jgi:prophage antirepressor-like protein/DNA-binding MarR family transcriptional regulator